jgi:hypothetical protein
MVVHSREICPNCVDFIEVSEEKKIVREDEICLVERVISRCPSCHQELICKVNFRFKTKMG